MQMHRMVQQQREAPHDRQAHAQPARAVAPGVADLVGLPGVLRMRGCADRLGVAAVGTGARDLVEGQKISFELERDNKSGKMSAGQLQAA